MIADFDPPNAISILRTIDRAIEHERRGCDRVDIQADLTARRNRAAPLNNLLVLGKQQAEFQGFKVAEVQSSGSLVLGKEVL